MYPFRKILFPVDYSEPCKMIVPFVNEMARTGSAQVTLVHADDAGDLVFRELPLAYSAFLTQLQDSQEQRLKEFAREMFPGRHVETIVKLGAPSEIIRNVVQHRGTDLVMLPTHGRGAVRRFLLGSVAAKVLHDVDCAVWTGTRVAFEKHVPHSAYKSILCATDDTDEAEDVLRAASIFARENGGELFVVHVVEMPPVSAEMTFEPYLKDLMEEEDSRLRQLKKQLNIDAAHAILCEPTAAGICQEAIRRKSDIIIVGRGRAQKKLSRIWSHLYQTIREAPCPVLSF